MEVNAEEVLKHMMEIVANQAKEIAILKAMMAKQS